MREKLFQYIWLFRHYNNADLRSIDNKKIVVVHPGQWNQHQGPDFLHAKILVDDVLLVGSVELHLHASEWLKHKHDASKHFDNVILHVVDEFDGFELPNVPTLELGDRIARSMVDKYDRLLSNESFIPCDSFLKTVPPIIVNSWLDRLLAERLNERFLLHQSLLKSANGNWNQVAWQLITTAFAPGINTSGFEMIANVVPYTKLIRDIHVPLRIEAMFMGVGGLLNGKFKDDYPKMLQKEFEVLRKKYGVKPIARQLSLLRLRPANFPAIRLSQLAGLFHLHPDLFAALIKIPTIVDMSRFLKVDANDYWNDHYRFDVKSSFKIKSLGKQMELHLIINVIIPLLYTYGRRENQPAIIDKVYGWMNSLPSEKNKILNSFSTLGLKASNAADAQALLQLKKSYCDEKRCLSCSIGNVILKKTSSP